MNIKPKCTYVLFLLFAWIHPSKIHAAHYASEEQSPQTATRDTTIRPLYSNKWCKTASICGASLYLFSILAQSVFPNHYGNYYRLLSPYNNDSTTHRHIDIVKDGITSEFDIIHNIEPLIAWEYVENTYMKGFTIHKAKDLALSSPTCRSSTNTKKKCVEALKTKTLRLSGTAFTTQGDIMIGLRPMKYALRFNASSGMEGTYFIAHTYNTSNFCFLSKPECIRDIKMGPVTPRNVRVPSLKNPLHCSNQSKICFLKNAVQKSYEQVLLERIRIGAAYTKDNLKIVMGILIRNDAERINKSIDLFKRLGAYFLDYRIVFIENDSERSDVLTAQCVQDDKIICSSNIFHLNKKLKKYKMPFRMKTMAMLRNFLLDITVLFFPDYDVLLQVDIDEFINYRMEDSHWPLGALSSFAGQSNTFGKIHPANNPYTIRTAPTWDMLCANGIFLSKRMWDTFAFSVKYMDEEAINSDWGIYPRQIPKDIRAQFDEMAMKYGVELIPVYSCFGPMAFYKIEALKDCRYFAMGRNCEHYSLHACLATHGKKAFVNPFMFAYRSREPSSVRMHCHCIS